MVTTELPFEYLSNALGITTVGYPLVQSPTTFNPAHEPLIIKTGNQIHRALKEEHLEAFYFNKFGKIIITASASCPTQKFQSIFEKMTFQSGFDPVVEETRTDYGDIMIHFEPSLLPKVNITDLTSK